MRARAVTGKVATIGVDVGGPSIFDNDVDALALGERAFRLGRGAAGLAVLAIGTEVGGALAGDVLVRDAHRLGGVTCL